MKLHLDTKVIFDSKENPEEVVKKYKNYIQHVHVGDQNLNEPGTINNEHSQQCTLLILYIISNVHY